MKSIYFSLLALSALMLFSCIGEDVIEDRVSAELRIENPLLSLGLNETYKFEVQYLNNVGKVEMVAVDWSSSDPSVVAIDANGLTTALKVGQATIEAVTVGIDQARAVTSVQVTGETIEETKSKTGTIATTSSYNLKGTFVLEPDASGALKLSIAENYEASTSLPGLYVYLTNNPNTISGAYEVGKVSVFRGSHSYVLPANVKPNDYSYLLYWCRPFSVKVGGGNIN